MENQNQNLQVLRVQEIQLRNIAASGDLIDILTELNDIVPFPLGMEMINRWARDVERLVPGVDVMKVAFMMDQFKMEKLYWDKSKGFQNIISGLKMVKVGEDGKYELIKPIF